MAISHYLKEIGRGKEGARHLSREQAADLFGQVLDGHVSDLELGAFCLAMRIKGETPEEMAGFLDATHQRMQRCPTAGPTAVVLPSYNGARKLPVLTPLLALLLAREGVPVLLHGTKTEERRIDSAQVLAVLGLPIAGQPEALRPGQVTVVPTEVLHPGLKRLLDVRTVVGLRNSAHSLVKLMNPCAGPALVVSSYTHPEYAVSMAETFRQIGAQALLLRGTEGEPVADPRRMPQMDWFHHGECHRVQEAQGGSLASVPNLPKDIDALSTARYTQAVLSGELPTPEPLRAQVQHILRALAAAP